MSIINIALQSVGLMRSPMPEELEKKLSGRNNVKQICEACEGCPELKDAVIDKQQPFEVFPAASSAEIESLWSHILHIDGQLSREDSFARILPQRPGLKKFLEHCCQERLYSFSIKKCGSTACSICGPPRLPAEVWVYLFTGLDYWTGILDWNTGLEYWTGILDWTTGLDDWTTGLDYWTGLLDWTTGLTFDLWHTFTHVVKPVYLNSERERT